MSITLRGKIVINLNTIEKPSIIELTLISTCDIIVTRGGEVMYKSYKFRLYPNKEQIDLINETIDCCRFVYNHYLVKMKTNGYMNAYSNLTDFTSVLKYETTFLQKIDNTTIRKTLIDLDNAYKKFFNKQGKYPKFKSKYSSNCYYTSAKHWSFKDKEYSNIELDLINRRIKLPNLNWVNIRGYRNVNNIIGKIINASISKEPNGKYYVSVLYDIYDKTPEVNHSSIVGIDLGIKKLLTLSDGTTYDNNRYIDKYEKRIKRKQRELFRKEKGSNNYSKCKKELAILYGKLSNARKYYIHKITKDITDEYDIITCEKLYVKEMITRGTKTKLSKKINDATLSEILRQLQYKSDFKGKKFYQVDTFYPSSQVCSRCDHRDIKYKDLKERTYKCSECNLEMDRDLNASINIMFEGLKLYMKDLARI